MSMSRGYETKEERKRRIKETFEKFDEDKSGTIEVNELVNGLSSLFNVDTLPAPETYKKFFVTIFNICDKGGMFRRKDQKLELDEFERIADAMPLQISRNVKSDMAKMLFNIIDKDKSGSISKKEVAKFLKYSDFAQKSVEQFIADLDKNGDGEIDFVEFLLWFEKLED